MNKTEDNKTTAPTPQEPALAQPNNKPGVYPNPVKGPLSDNLASYSKPRRFKGIDPDKNMGLYFWIFIIIMGILFYFAVSSLSGGAAKSFR